MGIMRQYLATAIATTVLSAIQPVPAARCECIGEGIESAPNEALVNALAMMLPDGPAEKQAMLEAPDLKTRAEILIAITEMDLAKKRTSGDPPLQ